MVALNGILSPAGSGGGVTGLTSAAGGTAIADNKVIRGDGTTGIQGSEVTIADTTGAMSVPQGWSVTSAGGASYVMDSGGGGRHLFRGSSGGDEILYLNPFNTAVTLDDAMSFGWSTNVIATAMDVALTRAAAGVVKITDGSTGNGSISVASGSAGSPSIRFTDDSDTGLCQTGSGRIQATVNGTVALTIYDSSTGVYPAGPVVGSGASATLYGFVKNVEANTAGSGSPNVLTSDETGKVFTNEGVTAENYHTLPTAVAGYEFTFVVQDTDGIRITAAAGDTIRPIAGTAASATGGFIRCATAGAFIRLQAINATEWIATGSAGVWTIDV